MTGAAITGWIIESNRGPLGHPYAEAPGTMKQTTISACCLLAAVALAACGLPLGQAPSSPKPVNAKTTLDAERGKVVFADDFKNARSGWVTGAVGGGPTTSYTDAGYVVVAAKRLVDNVVHSPYALALPQISVAATAAVSLKSPKGSAPGVGCSRGPSDKTIKYTFLVAVGGGWELMRRDTRAGAKTPATVLKRGAPPAPVGIDPLVIEGMCATLSDGKTTRVVFFINGIEVADVADRVADLPSVGWFGDLIVRGQKAAITTVIVTQFEVRNLVV